MDFKTYQKLRSYCWQDIGKYIDTPEANSVLEVYQKLHGPVGEIQHEQGRAMSLFQCKDLTPRENAAAHLLAVISNHRAMTWQRESEPPGDNEPAPPLTPEQHKAAWKQTRDAANEYAAFIAEREAAAIMATLEKSEPTRDFSEPEPAIHRSQAKDLIGITGVLVRSYAENGMHEQLRNDYGTTVYEAWLSLKCADLATLPAWDAETLRDAATVYLTHSSDMAARSGCTVETHIPEDVERVTRRIRLAMLAEKSPDVMSPTDGVLLLRRAGIHVFHELLDAVAQTQLAADETLPNYRLLMRIPEPQGSPASTVQKRTVERRHEKPNASPSPVFSMNRAAMIQVHKTKWPTIERDMKDASKNGLSAAKAGQRDWNEAAALDWARSKGRLNSEGKPIDALTVATNRMANLHSRKHKLDG